MKGRAALRLIKLGQEMVKAYEAAEGHKPTDRAIVLLSDGELGAINFAGYETDADVLKALYRYLDMACKKNGARLMIVRDESN